MTCIAPTNENMFNESSKFFPNDRYNAWVPPPPSNNNRKRHIEDFNSDEEAHTVPSLQMQEKRESLDRIKEIHDLSMRATLLNAEAYRYSEESMTQNNRKRLFTEYNSSPDFRNDYHPETDGRYKLTLSQFATSASEQEPLYPDDEDVEEILMRLRHGHDYYRPKASGPTPLPSLLFNPHHHSHHMGRPYYHDHAPFPQTVPHSSNKASLFHILSQPEPETVNTMSTPHMSVHSHNHNHNHHMRKLFFEEGVFDADELGLEHPKKKVRRDHKPKSPMKGIIVSNNDDVTEKENVAAGLCFKTHKPKVQREYYYAKLSKTIFRWTCCGSQAKTHPDA